MYFRGMKLALSFIVLFVALAVALPQTGVFVDNRDGHKYRTVVIGSKTWMAENLDYKTDESECYDDKAENCKKYGRLYTFEAARKACPVGWHLPENDEWSRFKNFIENSDGKEAAWVSLKSRDKWDGSDHYGFDVIPAGRATDEDGDAYGWHLMPPGDFARDIDPATNMYSVRCLRN